MSTIGIPATGSMVTPPLATATTDGASVAEINRVKDVAKHWMSLAKGDKVHLHPTIKLGDIS